MIHLDEKIVFHGANGAVPSFNTNIERPLRKCEFEIKCAQSGTGDPSPSNVRQITGYTQGKLHIAKKNILELPETTTYRGVTFTKESDGTLSISGKATGGITYYLHQYTNSFYGDMTVSMEGVITASPDSGGFYAREADLSGTGSEGRLFGPKRTSVTGSSTNGIGNVWMYFASGTTVSASHLKIMVAPTETWSAAFEPYDGNAYTFDWQSSAGTVYGGTLDATAGTLSVEWAMKTVSEFSWFYNSTYDRFAATFPEITEPGSARLTPLYCSAFMPISDGRALAEVPNNSIYAGGTSTHNIYIQGSGYTTEADFKSAFGDVQIVYPLKEPVVYQLTAQEITTLTGINNIYADTGAILACEYPVSLGDPYQNYFNAIRNGAPQHIRVTFLMDGIVFEDKDFTESCRLTTYMNPDIDLTFGTAFSSEVSLSFLHTQKTDQLNWPREFKVEFGVDDEYGTDWVQVGIFSGKRPRVTSGGVINFTANDRMQRFDRDVNDFLDLMEYPCTLRDLYDELCDFVMVEATAGDEIPDVMNRVIPEELERNGLSTCRDLLFMIAEANGCYARMTPEGYLQLTWFKNHKDDYTLDRDMIFSFESTNLMQFDGKTWGELSNYTWGQLKYFKWKELYNKVAPLFIQRILAKWKLEDEDVEVLHPPEGQHITPLTWDDADQMTWDDLEALTWDEMEGIEREGSIYLIEDNPFIYYGTEEAIRAHLELIIDRIKRFNLYYVAAVNAVGNWLLEAGDVISLELDSGMTMPYPIFSRTLEWNGFCECEYESTGNIIRGES